MPVIIHHLPQRCENARDLHFLGPFDASGRSTALRGLVVPVLDGLLLLNGWFGKWRAQIQGTCYGGCILRLGMLSLPVKSRVAE
jgi:hypothetical protein